MLYLQLPAGCRAVSNGPIWKHTVTTPPPHCGQVGKSAEGGERSRRNRARPGSGLKWQRCLSCALIPAETVPTCESELAALVSIGAPGPPVPH